MDDINANDLERLYKRVWDLSADTWTIRSVERRFTAYAEAQGYSSNEIRDFLNGTLK